MLNTEWDDVHYENKLFVYALWSLLELFHYVDILLGINCQVYFFPHCSKSHKAKIGF